MRFAIVGLCLFTVAAPGWAEAVDKDSWRTITVSGEGEVKLAPDKADLSVTLERDAKTAAEAKRDVDKLLKDALATIDEAGIGNKDVRTRASSLQPQYRYPEGGKPVLTGYHASHALQITVHDLAKLGPLTEALVSKGVDHLDDTAYGLADENAAKEQALAKALDAAKRKAAMLAQGLGEKLGQPVAINESGTSFEPVRPMMMRAKMADSFSSAGPEAAPAPPAGEIVIRSSLSATFALQ